MTYYPYEVLLSKKRVFQLIYTSGEPVANPINTWLNDRGIDFRCSWILSNIGGKKIYYSVYSFSDQRIARLFKATWSTDSLI